MDRRSALKKAGVLAGSAVAIPSFFSLLQSCKSETRLGWQPLFFTEIEAKTIAAILDMILPRTDTPGALDVKSDIFIDKVIAKTYVEEAQAKMRSEIAAFNSECEKNFGGAFIKLNASDREKVLQAAEKNSGKFSPGVWGTAVGKQETIGFYRSIKSMAIWAYFSSEEIGEKVLAYDPVPGTFEPCIPLSEGQNRWSL
jgi:hypothetical protein